MLISFFRFTLLHEVKSEAVTASETKTEASFNLFI
jgi:hypothetical protein